MIYLASGSPRRRELLKWTGIPFAMADKNEIDEQNHENLPPAQYAMDLALKKARAAQGIDEGLVLGADTIVVKRGGVILEKPDGMEGAKAHLRELSGQWHTVITAIALVEIPDGRELVDVEATRVLFSDLTDGEIDVYVATGEPMDKAGSYGIQEKGALIVSRIEGCYFNVVGLPLVKLTQMLDNFGIKRADLIKGR